METEAKKGEGTFPSNIPKITQLVYGGTRQLGSKAYTKPFPQIYSYIPPIHPINSSQSNLYETKKVTTITSTFKILQWFSVAL